MRGEQVNPGRPRRVSAPDMRIISRAPGLGTAATAKQVWVLEGRRDALLAILETERVLGLGRRARRRGLPRLHNCRARGCRALLSASETRKLREQVSGRPGAET